MKLIESISWYVHRLRAMNPAEWGHRLNVRWCQATQADFLKSLDAFKLGPTNAQVPRLPDKKEAPASLLAQLAEDAERLQTGKWPVFGWREVEVGAPPCWHRDPFCGVVIDPDTLAHHLNHRLLPDGADARTIWEINRWAEMTRLAMQGWLKGDVAAIRTAQLWLEDWCDRNPPGLGINWTSPLEVALRLINFTWFDALVEAVSHEPGAESLRANQSALVRRIVPVHAAWVWRYRSAGSSANNHLLGELVALVVACSRWRSLGEIACPAETAWDLLEQEVLYQFATDGGSREQALHYHLFALDLTWQAARVVGCRAGDVYERLIAAGEYFQALAHGEESWDFGDNDDAQVLPVTQHRALAIEEWLAWFRGENGALRFWLGTYHALKPCPAQCLFPKSGMAAVRADGWMIRLDASPLGFGKLAAHGHGDALQVSLWDSDEALLIDPGTGGYYGHEELRRELAAWEAHNGPQPVEGYRTPKRLGAFLWDHHHASPSVSLLGQGIQAQFHHEGHAFERVVTAEADKVTIRDVEAARKPFSVRWTFSPECVVKAGATDVWNVSRGGHVWELHVQPKNARVLLMERRVSPAYGCIETATVLRVESREGEATLTIRRKR